MRHQSDIFPTIARNIVCLFLLVWATNSFAQQLISDPTPAAPQQLAITLSGTNSMVSTNGSTKFVTPTPTATTGNHTTPISASSFHSRRTLHHSVPTAGSFSSSFGTSARSTAQQGSGYAGSALPSNRRQLSFRAIDAFSGYLTQQGSGKNPPYNPPEVSDENFDDIKWQKATNGSPIGDSLLPLLLMAVVFILLRRLSVEHK